MHEQLCQLPERRRNPSYSNNREAAKLNQSSSMLNRSSNTHVYQYDGDNTFSLHAKLHQEADKIRKWKVQTEIDLKEKDKKLAESSCQIECLKKSLLELQLENERTSSKLQEEIDNHQEIMLRMTTTMEMCNALKTQATKLEGTLLRCETEKTELKYMGKEQMQHFEELANKFDNLHLTSANNHESLLKRVEKERQKYEDESKDLAGKLASSDNEKKRLEDKLNNIREVNETLQDSLKKKEEEVETITLLKDKLDEKTASLSSKLAVLEEELKETSLRVVIVQDEKSKLENKIQTLESEIRDLHEMKKMTSFELAEVKTKHETDNEKAMEEKALLETAMEDKSQRLKDCELKLSESTLLIENLKSSNDMLMLERTDLEMKLDVKVFEMESLKRDKEEYKDKIHQLTGETQILLKKLDKENLCSLHYEGQIENLENKISMLELEKDDKMKLIEDLKNDLTNHQEEVKSLQSTLSCEKNKVQSLQAEIHSMEENMTDSRKEQDKIQSSVSKLEMETLKKDSQISNEIQKNAELEKKVEDLLLTNQMQQDKLNEINNDLESVRFSYENEKQKADDLFHQIRDSNHKNKEQVKHLKTELTELKKKSAEKDKRISSLEISNEQLALSRTESEKELELKMEQCNKEKEASAVALRKAEEMQSVVQREKEQAKALTANELAAMMATLENYKQTSEKMLAQKDTELEMMRNKLTKSKNAGLADKKENEKERKRLTSELESCSEGKENLCIQLKDVTSKNQELLNRIKDLEDKLSSKEREIIKSSFNTSDDIKAPVMQKSNSPSTPVVHVTPQKQQIILSPMTPVRPSAIMTPTQNILKTPQRSILRNCNSVPKRRKVGFLADNYTFGSSSEESDLMELDVKDPVDGFETKCLPSVASKSPFRSQVKDLDDGFEIKRSPSVGSKSPFRSQAYMLKTPPRTPNLKGDGSTPMKTDQNQTPHLRKAPAKKTSSKFFTTSPRVKAAQKFQSKSKTSQEPFWFDQVSVYDFEPED